MGPGMVTHLYSGGNQEAERALCEFKVSLVYIASSRQAAALE